MRIYMIGTKGLPSATVAGAGGVERHVEEISTRLAKDGNDVFVYVRSRAKDEHRAEFQGVHLIHLPSIPTKNLDTISHTFLATLHVLFQPADIIHYHGVGPSTLAWIPRLFKPRARVVCTFHSRDWQDAKWGWFAKLFLKFGAWAAVHIPHKTIVVSHVLQVEICKQWKKEVAYIPNGAKLLGPQGTEELQTFGLQPGKYLLGVGRLVPNKAFEIAIKAYKKVESDFPLVIVGRDYHASAYGKELHALAKKDARVKLVGYQSGRALHQLFAHCYAFVHSSRAEGLSVTIIEAMAAGKLVIMSDIRENLELVDHSGIAYPVDDIHQLARTIDLVLSDPTMVSERGRRAREVVRKDYSWSSVTSRLETLYKNLLQERL